APNERVMALEDHGLGARVGVPQPDSAVARRGNDLLTVRAECDAEHGICVTLIGADLLLGLGIPQPHSFVGGSGCHAFAVGAEGSAHDRAAYHPAAAVVALEFADHLKC